MKKINRNKFFISLGTGFISAAFLRNFNFEALRKKKVADYPVKVEANPLSVSRNNPGGNNVGK
jgi:hypothetical protein